MSAILYASLDQPNSWAIGHRRRLYLLNRILKTGNQFACPFAFNYKSRSGRLLWIGDIDVPPDTDHTDIEFRYLIGTLLRSVSRDGQIGTHVVIKKWEANINPRKLNENDNEMVHHFGKYSESNAWILNPKSMSIFDLILT